MARSAGPNATMPGLFRRPRPPAPKAFGSKDAAAVGQIDRSSNLAESGTPGIGLDPDERRIEQEGFAKATGVAGCLGSSCSDGCDTHLALPPITKTKSKHECLSD